MLTMSSTDSRSSLSKRDLTASLPTASPPGESLAAVRSRRRRRRAKRRPVPIAALRHPPSFSPREYRSVSHPSPAFLRIVQSEDRDGNYNMRCDREYRAEYFLHSSRELEVRHDCRFA